MSTGKWSTSLYSVEIKTDGGRDFEIKCLLSGPSFEVTDSQLEDLYALLGAVIESVKAGGGIAPPYEVYGVR